jgi:hypothetical protein
MLATKSWRKLTLISLIVGDPYGILDQQLKPHIIHLPNLIIIILIGFNIYIILKWLIKRKNEDNSDQSQKQNSNLMELIAPKVTVN